MENMCNGGVCSKCWGWKFVIVGLIFIANELWFFWNVWILIGVLLVLKGVMKLAMPSCGHCCKPAMPEKKGRKK
ncbi:MAG TPA: hypothetical protein VI564_01765 [Candidatus Nanoarchaeia archaeon]|nr:hypothetical protein [Candidatus Nanoarchaeia archaeon]